MALAKKHTLSVHHSMILVPKFLLLFFVSVCVDCKLVWLKPNSANTSLLQSEDRNGSQWRPSRRSKSEGPARCAIARDAERERERRRESDPDVENMVKITTKQKHRFVRYFWTGFLFEIAFNCIPILEDWDHVQISTRLRHLHGYKVCLPFSIIKDVSSL